MTERRVTRAIVLAAGMGSRLGEADAAPKPLRAVAGVPLLVRVLMTLQSAGIQEAVIVVGNQAQQVRRALLSEPAIGLNLTFVENPEYTKKNGVSLLAAAHLVDQECLLTMADHLYSPELVRRVLAANIPDGACALGVDFEVERCFDLDDATKVQTEDGRILQIGKELEQYDAIDTGVFRIGPALVRELAAVEARDGDCSLSDGVAALSKKGAFFVCDVCDVRWIDVDTPAALERAEAMIRVFGESLGDEPGMGGWPTIDPEAIELFAPSWVRAARPYDEGHFAVARESNVLRLMANESPYSPSRRVINAIVEAALRGNQYPDRGQGLRSKLADREELEASNVLLGAGSTELIDVVIRTFVAPGEEVLLSVPTFSMYEARARVAGGIPVLVPLTEEQEHDIPALIRAVTERTKVVFICTPNNPTGTSVSEAQLKRLLRLGLPTVIDEAYFDFGDTPSCAALLKEFPNAILLRTFSKAFGLAGLRIGYALAHEAVIRLLERVKAPWTIPATSIAAATAVLEDEAEVEARLTELRQSHAELAEKLARVPGLRPTPGDGNFISVDISATGYTANELVSAVLEEGVLIRALGAHHATKSFVRVTVGTREQNLRCVEALERAVLRRRQPLARAEVAAVGGAE